MAAPGLAPGRAVVHEDRQRQAVAAEDRLEPGLHRLALLVAAGFPEASLTQVPHGAGADELRDGIAQAPLRKRAPDVAPPPAADLLRKASGIAKGSGKPNREKSGTVSKAQIEEIAKKKMQDLNTTNLESAMRTIEGTAKSMGLTVEG